MGWREKNRPANPSGVRFGERWWYWGGSKRCWGGLMRHPRTTQERRLWDDEYGRKARRKLPNSWDDIMRSDYCHHTWKRHRRHQWFRFRERSDGG